MQLAQLHNSSAKEIYSHMILIYEFGAFKSFLMERVFKHDVNYT